MLGANKFDLMLDYLAQSPPAGADPAGYRRVRVAMAQKAIADARDAGLTFFRVAVTGYAPHALDSKSNDLRLWQADPSRFWAALDQMFDDLDASGLRLVPSFVWNVAQFPALAHDNIATFIRDPNSASRRLLAKFIREFIGRYKGRKTILFYEMGNELNLLVDLDLRRRCRADPCLWADFTTADMNNFARQMVHFIKSLDPTRGISSGYALPRASAAHLERRPQFSRRGADWTADTEQEFAAELLAIHQPFDIISIHVYPGDGTRLSHRAPGQRFDTIRISAVAAHRAGKRLFIGEFGDRGGATPFLARTVDKILRGGVDYAAIWAWEFYQFSIDKPGRFNVEPGLTPGLIQQLNVAGTQLATLPRRKTTPHIVITSPLPCARINKPIKIAAVASDGAAAPKQVEFFVDNKRLAILSHPPYTTRFDPVGQGPRLVMIKACAIGRSGAISVFRTAVHLNGSRGRCDAS